MNVTHLGGGEICQKVDLGLLRRSAIKEVNKQWQNKFLEICPKKQGLNCMII